MTRTTGNLDDFDQKVWQEIWEEIGQLIKRHDTLVGDSPKNVYRMGSLLKAYGQLLHRFSQYASDNDISPEFIEKTDRMLQRISSLFVDIYMVRESKQSCS